MTERLTTRRATTADIESLVAIVRSDPQSTWTAQAFVGELEQVVGNIEVACVAQEVVGFVVYRTVADELEILHIGTAAAWRDGWSSTSSNVRAARRSCWKSGRATRRRFVSIRQLGS